MAQCTEPPHSRINSSTSWCLRDFPPLESGEPEPKPGFGPSGSGAGNGAGRLGSCRAATVGEGVDGGSGKRGSGSGSGKNGVGSAGSSFDRE